MPRNVFSGVPVVTTFILGVSAQSHFGQKRTRIELCRKNDKKKDLILLVLYTTSHFVLKAGGTTLALQFPTDNTNANRETFNVVGVYRNYMYVRFLNSVCM